MKCMLDPKDLEIQDLALPLTGPVQTVMTSKDNQSQASEVASIILKPRQHVMDYGYMSPDPVSKTRVVLTQKSMILSDEHQGPETEPITHLERVNIHIDMLRRRQLIRARKVLNF